jgi:hypothetical protein
MPSPWSFVAAVGANIPNTFQKNSCLTLLIFVSYDRHFTWTEALGFRTYQTSGFGTREPHAHRKYMPWGANADISRFILSARLPTVAITTVMSFGAS